MKKAKNADRKEKPTTGKGVMPETGESAAEYVARMEKTIPRLRELIGSGMSKKEALKVWRDEIQRCKAGGTGVDKH